MNNCTPDNIDSLEENEYFVFGSNEGGYHDGGAARVAVEKFNAIYEKPFGIQGNSFAIPTLDKDFKQLSLEKIKTYIHIAEAIFEANPDNIFYVTKIGCGIAGFDIKDIAPLFERSYTLENVYMPKEFYDYISWIVEE